MQQVGPTPFHHKPVFLTTQLRKGIKKKPQIKQIEYSDNISNSEITKDNDVDSLISIKNACANVLNFPL